MNNLLHFAKPTNGMGRVEASDVRALPRLRSPTDVVPGKENAQHPWLTTHTHTP